MKKGEMDCVFCGKENVELKAVIFGPPEADCPFSFNQGKGMICLDCYTNGIPCSNMREFDRL